MGYQGVDPYIFRGTFTNIDVFDTPLPRSPGPGSGFNGTQTDFKLQLNGADVTEVSAKSLLITLGGVTQRPTTDYTISNGILTFTTAPVNGLTVEVRKLQSISSEYQLQTDENIDGSLGINISDPSYYGSNTKLALGSTTSNSNLTIVSPTTGVGSLFYADGNGDASYAGYLQYRHDTNQLRIGTEGEERVRFGSGDVTLYQSGTNGNTSTLGFEIYGGTATDGNGILEFKRSRSTVLGTQTAVSNNTLGQIKFSGSDGTSFGEGARIEAKSFSTWSGSDRATQLIFHVTPDSSTTLTEAMRINYNGYIGMGEDNPVANLHIAFPGHSRPNSSAVTASSGPELLLSGIDSSIDLLSADDNSTVASSIGMGRYVNTDDGTLIDKWGLVTWYDTGNAGANLSDRLGIHYGTSRSPWDNTNTEVVSITREGSVGIGAPTPLTTFHVKGAYPQITVQDSDNNNIVNLGTDGSEDNFNIDWVSVSQRNINLINSGTGVIRVGIDTEDPSATLHVNSTDSIIVPVGSTADRASTAVKGMFRLNTSTGDSLEYYNGTSWITVGAMPGTSSNPLRSVAQAQSTSLTEGLYYFENSNGDTQEMYYDPSDGGWILLASNNASSTTIPGGNSRQNLIYTLDRNGTNGALGTADPDDDYIVGNWYMNFSFTRARVYGFGANSTNGTYTWSGNRGNYVDVQFPATSRTSIVQWSSGNVTWGGNDGDRFNLASYFGIDAIYSDYINGGFSANANQTTIGGYAANTSADPTTGTYLGHGSNEASFEGWYSTTHNAQNAQGYTTWIR